MPLIILENHDIVSVFHKIVARRLKNINQGSYIVKPIQASHYSKILYSDGIAGILSV